MIRITLLKSPTGCRKCRETEAVLRAVVERHPDDLELELLESTDPAADQYGIVMTPAVVIGGRVLSSRKVPREDRIEAYLERLLAEQGSEC